MARASTWQTQLFHAAFHTDASRQLESLVRTCGGMRGELSDLTAHFGDDDEPDAPEQVLRRINAFVTSFGKACRDNERANFLLRKAEAEAAERAKRSEAQPRRPSLRTRSTSAAAGVMSSIQGSLRRGEFANMKNMQAAVQKQMSAELQARIAARRSSVIGGSRD